MEAPGEEATFYAVADVCGRTQNKEHWQCPVYQPAMNKAAVDSNKPCRICEVRLVSCNEEGVATCGSWHHPLLCTAAGGVDNAHSGQQLDSGTCSAGPGREDLCSSGRNSCVRGVLRHTSVHTAADVPQEQAAA